MKSLPKLFIFTITLFTLLSCSKENDNSTSNSLSLHFNNTFKAETIVLGGPDSKQATVNVSSKGQSHHFSELKYVISNVRLIKANGEEVSYFTSDLDKGAFVINQANAQSLDYVLSDIPAAEYVGIKFGLGVSPELNTLDQTRFPNFYEKAGENDTEMHWDWGTGYRFTKIEGFYDTDNKALSIHTGSTLQGTNGQPDTYVQGVNAYRDITLTFQSSALVSNSSPRITIQADFDKLLSGESNTITLGEDNAGSSVHSALNMVMFVDNIGGNGTTDTKGMFSISSVEN